MARNVEKGLSILWRVDTDQLNDVPSVHCVEHSDGVAIVHGNDPTCVLASHGQLWQERESGDKQGASQAHRHLPLDEVGKRHTVLENVGVLGMVLRDGACRLGYNPSGMQGERRSYAVCECHADNLPSRGKGA